jgi:hypothetical protein
MDDGQGVSLCPYDSKIGSGDAGENHARRSDA